jgi:hypothetical protein
MNTTRKLVRTVPWLGVDAAYVIGAVSGYGIMFRLRSCQPILAYLNYRVTMTLNIKENWEDSGQL